MHEQLPSILVGTGGVILPHILKYIFDRKERLLLQQITADTSGDRTAERYSTLVERHICYPLMTYTGLNVIGAVATLGMAALFRSEMTVSGAGLLGLGLGFTLVAALSAKRSIDTWTAIQE